MDKQIIAMRVIGAASLCKSLLDDAIDAIEIGEPQIAQRRIASAEVHLDGLYGLEPRLERLVDRAVSFLAADVSEIRKAQAILPEISKVGHAMGDEVFGC